jgi:GrpB-like predicted nucleotidyltransferase (UPF0157 family)
MSVAAAIEIVDYDPQWPQLFADLSAAIRGHLGDLAIGIEHVGSTAIPGLCAKPIIDLDVVIASRDHLPRVIQALAQLGYEHQGDLGIAQREAFRRTGSDVPRHAPGRFWPEHHLYVCATDNLELCRHITFRDALRAHSAQAAAYALLKRHLAEQFRHDRNAYCEAKTLFVESVLGAAQPDRARRK